MRRFTIVLVILCLIGACTKTNEQALLLEAQQQELCTKDTISYSQHIHPLVQTNCMPCHNSSQAEAGIVLDSYTDVQSVDSTLLFGVINHEPGFLQMPKDRPKLKDCEIRAIEVWVRQGKMNN